MAVANLKVQEPSMEEILASIRRIIADDQDGGRKARQTAPAPAARPASDPDDVLDLADFGIASAQPAPDLDPDDDDLRESGREIDFDSIEFDATPEEEPAVEPEPEPEPAPVVKAARPAKADPVPEPVPAVAPGGLLSRSADASVTSAFSMLTSTVLTSSTRTLEDLVKEMLRPMLKGWLDENLPPLVERLVQAEIERITRSGR